ncbi:T9SS type A sorting domain-containing protein, partial [Nonlabens xiamenensis]|uniref:T9SS type A sorting domain-containing protein n=1 Tax=Nonlabens xiamenensis TaxID=2341043 RepID=UPI0013DDA614
LDGSTTSIRQENGAPYEWNAPGQNDPALQTLSVGTHTIRAVVVDNEGATAEAVISITVNRAVPQGTFYLQNVATGNMLESEGGGAIGLYTPSTIDEKKWNFIPSSDGYVMLDNGLVGRGPIRASTGVNSPLVWVSEGYLASPYVNREWLPILVSGNIYKFECRDAVRGYIADIGGNAVNSANGDVTTAHWELIPFGDSSVKSGSNNDFNQNALINEMVMYPNPMTNTLYIELSGAKSADISIFNVDGQLIMQEKYTGGTLTINTDGKLKTGIYFVKSVSENGTVLTKKLAVY